MNADPFIELETRAKRSRARMSSEYGFCPFCRQAATDVLTVQGVSWALCCTCDARWHAGTNIVDDEHSSVRDLELLFRILASYRQACNGNQPLNWRAQMRRQTTDPEVEVSDPMADMLCDPFAGLPPSTQNDPKDPMIAPSGWLRYTSETRERFVAATLEAARLLSSNDALRISARALDIIRAHFTAPDSDDAAAYGYPTDFARYYAADPLERQRWRRAERELATSNASHYLLLHLAQKLRASGDLLCALQARRGELDKQIARLERFASVLQVER
jgi:hypothetical protein